MWSKKISVFGKKYKEIQSSGFTSKYTVFYFATEKKICLVFFLTFLLEKKKEMQEIFSLLFTEYNSENLPCAFACDGVYILLFGC